jgi:tetratricopeptide (TPR) repeat protein
MKRRQPPSPDASSPDRRSDPTALAKRIGPALAVLAAGILFAATFAAYSPIIHGGFIWDDDDYVQHNPLLASAPGLWRIWFEVGATPQYYPLVHTTFWLEYRLWGVAPAGYHLVNVILHALGAALLWRLLKRLEVPGAWLAAAVFALHPVQVESAAWITERKNVLSGLLFFAAALLYLRSLSPSADPWPRRPSFGPYAAAFLLFVAALLSKTTACALPAALLLVSWWKRNRCCWNDVLWLLPFFAVGASFGLLTAWMEKTRVGASGEEWNWSLVDRCLLAGRALWFYAAKLFWPCQLSFFYPKWAIDAASWRQYIFPLAAIAVPTVLWRARRQFGKGPLVAVLYFGGVLLPALGFINVYPMRYSYVADHFQYLASAGPIALVIAAVSRLFRRFRRSAAVSATAAAGLLCVLAILTCLRTRAFTSLDALWRDTLEKNPQAWMVHNNLGNLLQARGRMPDAMLHFQEALRIKPNEASVHNNLAGVLVSLGRFDEAIEQCREAVRLLPDYVNAHQNLALLCAQRGYLPEAVEHYREALRLQPDLVQMLNNLAWILATSADPGLRREQEAVALAERAAELTQRKRADILDTLAAAYAAAGRFDDALAAAGQAERIAAAAGDADRLSAVRSRLDLYRQNRPYRE